MRRRERERKCTHLAGKYSAYPLCIECCPKREKDKENEGGRERWRERWRAKAREDDRETVRQ